jgi:hypothetical protein
MQIEVVHCVPAHLREPLWALYGRAFETLRVNAVQSHLMDRRSFEDQLDDARVGKYVVADEERAGRPCALATLTNDLDAMPLVSQDFFAHRWPQLHRDGKVWYLGYLAIDPDYQGTGAVGLAVGRICETVAARGGVVGLDICEYNEATMRLPMAIGRLARTFTPGVTLQRLDAQVYWAYEFPVPTATGEVR